ncbi:MAG: sugar transferase, partial [Bacteroidota bacterium]
MHRFLIRLSDIILGSVGLLVSLPFFLIISIAIVVGSGLPVFYIQRRVGRFGKEFSLLKFRTMKVNAERSGQLTVGGKDSRITTIGYWLRRYKLDELPQLLHVISGSMSLVGPRPEVPKYVELYSLEQRLVLGVRPGITDEASLVYFNENELLRMST